jgi:hypothetical protein
MLNMDIPRLRFARTATLNASLENGRFSEKDRENKIYLFSFRFNLLKLYLEILSPII